MNVRYFGTFNIFEIFWVTRPIAPIVQTSFIDVIPFRSISQSFCVLFREFDFFEKLSPFRNESNIFFECNPSLAYNEKPQEFSHQSLWKLFGYEIEIKLKLKLTNLHRFPLKNKSFTISQNDIGGYPSNGYPVWLMLWSDFLLLNGELYITHIIIIHIEIYRERVQKDQKVTCFLTCLTKCNVLFIALFRILENRNRKVHDVKLGITECNVYTFLFVLS